MSRARIFITAFVFLTAFFCAPAAMAACSNPAGIAGDIEYNTTDSIMQYCDGTNWISMGQGPGTGGGCTGPAGSAGDMIYNMNFSVPQYCNGNEWVAMGRLGTSATSAPTSGLTGHWKLDETSGTTANDSAGSNNGTLGGGLDAGTDSVAGVNGTALDFNGTSDRITMGDVLDQVGNPFTLSTWVKFKGFNGFDPIIDKYNPTSGFAIFVQNNGQKELYFNLRIDGSTVDTLYSGYNLSTKLNEWKHIVATYDDVNTAKLYVDGVLVKSVSYFSGAHTNSSAPLAIGYQQSSNRYSNAVFDDARVYNRVLTDAEVTALYEASAPVNQDILAHWKLDETAGTAAADSSGNGYNGTMQGGLDAGTATTTGQISTALTFNGTSDYIDTADIDIPWGGYTLTAWAKSSSATDQWIIGKRSGVTNQIGMSLGASGEFNCVLHDGTSVKTSTQNAQNYADGQWHFIACVIDNANITTYVDGVAATPVAHDNYFPTNNDPWVIGRRNNSAGHYFNGQIDDVRIYNRILGASELQRLYGCTNPSGIEGDMFFNQPKLVMQYCNGEDWMAVGRQPGTDCPNVGDQCADGSYYAGLSPDGNEKMYVADASTQVNKSYNNGNNGNWVAAGTTSTTDGDGNTATLIVTDSDSGTAGTQPHQAAQYCEDLTAHGHNDWYLPALGEMQIIYNGGSPVAGITTGYYSNSTEQDAQYMKAYYADTGGWASRPKNMNLPVRCVRRY